MPQEIFHFEKEKVIPFNIAPSIKRMKTALNIYAFATFLYALQFFTKEWNCIIFPILIT